MHAVKPAHNGIAGNFNMFYFSQVLLNTGTSELLPQTTGGGARAALESPASIIIGEVTRASDNRDPEYCLLLEERNPVLKNPVQMSVFCTFRDLADPRSPPVPLCLLHSCEQSLYITCIMYLTTHRSAEILYVHGIALKIVHYILLYILNGSQ